MSYPIKIAEFDMSLFTEYPSWLVLTAEEAAHGYDYTLAYYSSDAKNPLGLVGRWMFYDQPSADATADFMVAKIKEILG